jgi:hypothetical protein
LGGDAACAGDGHRRAHRRRAHRRPQTTPSPSSSPPLAVATASTRPCTSSASSSCRLEETLPPPPPCATSTTPLPPSTASATSLTPRHTPTTPDPAQGAPRRRQSPARPVAVGFSLSTIITIHILPRLSIHLAAERCRLVAGSNRSEGKIDGNLRRVVRWLWDPLICWAPWDFDYDVRPGSLQHHDALSGGTGCWLKWGGLHGPPCSSFFFV